MNQSLIAYSLSADKLVPNLTFSPATQKNLDFLALQPKAKGAIDQFLHNKDRQLLILKIDDSQNITPYLAQYIDAYMANKPIKNEWTYQIKQGKDYLFPEVSLVPVSKNNPVFVETKQVATALFFDQSTLLGSVSTQGNQIQLRAGLLHQLHQGVLILSVEALLQDFSLWAKLKQALFTQQAHWYSTDPFKTLPCTVPAFPLDIKIILVGDRSALALLNEEDENLYDYADYAEIDRELGLKEEGLLQQWAEFIQALAQQKQLEISADGLNTLYQILVRETEDCLRVSISPSKLCNLLVQSAIFSNTKKLGAKELQAYFKQLIYQQNNLQEQTIDAIMQEQIYVATEGEVVGQINGLSVIEYAGVPFSFGEPIRISCLVQFGEGEIVDVERKNELAGNLHSKGLMIAQACLSNILNLPAQLPFAATVVFEQSYGEIDGDSASLACLLSLVSALADEPIPQNIAVTGSIDQFGIVHTVGGVNDKVEGFFTLCQQRGLTGKQGVIIPKSTLNQLSLIPEVVQAVSKKQFNLWVVEDVNQACEIMFDQPLFSNQKTDELSLVQRINQRLERFGEHSPKTSLWARLFHHNDE